MADTATLSSRIDAEFIDVQKKIQAFQKEAEQEYLAREKRYHELYVPAVKRLVEIVKPRLEVLVEKFKDKVHVTPLIAEHLRAVNLKFDARVARIELNFSASHDAPVKNLVVEQTLDVLPILMQFEKHSSLKMPLDKIDDDKLVRWVDDRIVAFVQTFMAIHQNQYYQKDQRVTDPVSGTEMPRYAAKCTYEAGGKTYYFVSDETKRVFLEQQSKK